MALVVEDGTGLATADSYVSLADASTYAIAKGLTFAITGGDQTTAEQALRRATTWIDAVYASQFSGVRKNRRSQALEWPRVGAVDRDYNYVANDAVPIEIVRATVEAAVREKATPGSLNPDITPGKVKRAFRVGEIAVEYAVGSGSVQEQQPVVTVINGILSRLLGGAGSPLSGGATRT